MSPEQVREHLGHIRHAVDATFYLPDERERARRALDALAEHIEAQDRAIAGWKDDALRENQNAAHWRAKADAAQAVSNLKALVSDMRLQYENERDGLEGELASLRTRLGEAERLLGRVANERRISERRGGFTHLEFADTFLAELRAFLSGSAPQTEPPKYVSTCASCGKDLSGKPRIWSDARGSREYCSWPCHDAAEPTKGER